METKKTSENLNSNKTQTTEKTMKEDKTRIYNLIVLDRSGSMESMREAAYTGCNEVLAGIRAAATKHAEDQEQFVSLMLFDSEGMPLIYNCTSAADAINLTEDQYVPGACTPLYDAIGTACTQLEAVTSRHEDAVGMVTIITDGYENASQEFTHEAVVALIDRLKKKGWNFAFMGANIDVMKVSMDLHIQNHLQFAATSAGMRASMQADRDAKQRYYERMKQVKERTAHMTSEEREAAYEEMNESVSYFA